MEAVSGVFKTQADAERAVSAAYKLGIAPDKITILMPGTQGQIRKEAQSVPVDTAEQPGIGEAFGALAGGGVGITAGSLLIALVPGLGPISALGLLGAAILGAAGATVGAVVGDKLEESTARGLPEDEIFVYEDALRQGRSVVIGMVADDNAASRLRELLTTEGAESVDAAREQWWIGLRNAEESHYTTRSGGNFSDSEKFYRLGFEAALHSRIRCMEFDQVSAAMDAALEEVQKQYPGVNVEEPFTLGYMRGREHYQQLCDENQAA
jgi:hypothetical protein